MMKKIILFLLAIVFWTACKTQKRSVTQTSRTEKVAESSVKVDKGKYAILIKEALALYEQKDYSSAAKKFQEGFDAMGGDVADDDRYKAACANSLAGNSDEAFSHLFRLGNVSRYSNLKRLTTDPDLEFLHKDKRWDEIVEIVKWNKKNEPKYSDKPLAAKLEKIFTEDQKYRKQLPGIQEKYGIESKEVRAQWKIINEKDSLNLIEVRSILDTKGWLGPAAVGKKGNLTLFLVIQHADLGTQEKYLPMMREAVQKGNARPSNLALLEDRVALRQGKKQIYGSQIYTDKETGEAYVAPLIDPEHVDERRAKMGLGRLADYARRWDIIWDVKKYKETMARKEAKNK